MKSMTGYGKAFAEKEGRKIVVELKAVNHRFLDLNFKLPRAFAAFEDKIRRIVSARVVRGHVDVFLTYADNGLRPKRVDADLQLAKGILDCAELLKNEFDLINDFQLTSLMKTPDVVTVTFDDDAPEILEALLSEAVAEAAEKLDEIIGTRVGATTIFGVLRPEAEDVQVVFDKVVCEDEWYGCSDGTTTGYMKLKTKDILEKLLPCSKHRYTVIDV